MASIIPLVLKSLGTFCVLSVSLLFVGCASSLLLGVIGVLVFHNDIFMILLLCTGGLLPIIAIFLANSIRRLERRLKAFSPYGRSSNKYFRQTYVLPRHGMNQYAHVRMIAFTHELQKMRSAGSSENYYAEPNSVSLRQEITKSSVEEERN